MTLIRPSRRDILRLAAAAPGFALPAIARADLGAPALDNPAHFRFSLGDARLTVISDGFFMQSMKALGINADRAKLEAELAAYFLPQDANYAHTNHLLIEMGEAKVLVDVGSGSRFVETTGRLMSNLEGAGIDPATISHVFITHAHPDHIWGIRDDFDEPIFPDATYFIGEAEHDYWLKDGLVDTVATEDQQFVVGAVNSLKADGVDWQLVGDGEEIAPGMRAIASPGHTAGHMSLHLDTGGRELIVTGDALSQVWLNFAHPGWYNGIDQDPEQTVASRNAMLDRAAADKIALVGYHFPFPGVGHVLREGDAFRFVPALWKFIE